MNFQILDNQCWNGSLGPVHMGCHLELSKLTGRGFLLRSVKQVHGNLILDDLAYLNSRQEADGLMTDMKNQVLIIKTADCVPLHLTDGRRVAILHAGWRGTRDGIVTKALQLFEPVKTWAVIGPAIDGERYEVDRELYEHWSSREPALARHLHPIEPDSSKRRFDLKSFIRNQLKNLGVVDEHIRDIGICTHRSGLPSYRRDGGAAQSIFNYIYRGSEST